MILVVVTDSSPALFAVHVRGCDVLGPIFFASISWRWQLRMGSATDGKQTILGRDAARIGDLDYYLLCTSVMLLYWVCCARVLSYSGGMSDSRAHSQQLILVPWAKPRTRPSSLTARQKVVGVGMNAGGLGRILG